MPKLIDAMVAGGEAGRHDQLVIFSWKSSAGDDVVVG